MIACRRASTSALYGCGVPKPDRAGDKWLYFVRGGKARDTHHIDHDPEPEKPPEYPDVSDSAHEFAARLTPELLVELGERIGVPDWALRRFPLVGWDRVRKTWMFPSVDGAGRIIGIGRRGRDAKDKGFVSGHHAGVYTSPDWHLGTGDIYIPEGQSCVMALAAAGCAAIGRHSCRAGVSYLVGLLRAVSPERRIIVVGERDAKADGTWPGRSAAYHVAVQLAEGLGRPVHWSLPPGKAKDSRAWLNKLAAKRTAKKRYADRAVEAIHKAVDGWRVPVTDSRRKWSKLGGQYAAEVLAQAVPVEPGKPTPPTSRPEPKCPTPWCGQFKGKPDTTADGKRACGDARCKGWGCDSCRIRNANLWGAWLWRCVYTYADPERCPPREERETRGYGSGGDSRDKFGWRDSDDREDSPPEDRLGWPDAPSHKPAGPCGLFAAIVNERGVRRIRDAVNARNAGSGRRAEYVHIRLANPGAGRGVYAETRRLVEDRPELSLRVSDGFGAHFLTVVSCRPGTTPPKGMVPIGSDDAAELITTALREVPKIPGRKRRKKGVPKTEAEEERNRPVAASAMWRLPKTVTAGLSRWWREGSAGASAKRIHLVHLRLDAADTGDAMRAEDIQDSTVRRDADLGGELCSWLLVQMLTPEHIKPDFDVDDLKTTFRWWKRTIAGVEDCEMVREYLREHCGRLPTPADREALLAAVERDRDMEPTRELARSLWRDITSTPLVPDWANPIILRGMDRIRDGECVGVVRADVKALLLEGVTAHPSLALSLREAEFLAAAMRCLKRLPKAKDKPTKATTHSDLPAKKRGVIEGLDALAY